jgi:hypothetical protein
MYFSFFLIPALWVVDIFLFNLEELIYNWKLFEYIQFCNERFANRSRRWVGLDNTINEELPPDLRSMDQMCLSTQFYLLGSLHASGIVMSVLGYMLVLHQQHNLFGDPMVMPLFSGVTIFLKGFGKVAIKIGDRFKIWVVEGEDEIEDEYDEGPGSRNKGALPPGLAAIDAGIAECIEDAFSVGYTDDTLSKLLMEAISYVPPGSSIQVAGSAASVGTAGQATTTEQPMQQMQHMQQMTQMAQMPQPQMARMPKPQMPQVHCGASDAPGTKFEAAPGAVGRTVYDRSMRPDPPGTRCIGPLSSGVQPTPHFGTHGGKGELAFSDFMAAFRYEMRQAQDQGHRMQKVVPSKKVQGANRQDMERRMNDVFGVGSDVIHSFSADEAFFPEEFNEWPDEFLLLGVAEQEAEAVSSPSLESDTSSTSDTVSTVGETDETDGEEAEMWPIEMLVG